MSILYLSGCTNPPTAAAAATQRRLGILAQPGNSIHLQKNHYDRWAIDNGAFGHARKVAKGEAKVWGDAETAKYLTYLGRVLRDVGNRGVLFATAPDVLWFACLTHDAAKSGRTLSCKLAFERIPDRDGRKCKGVPIGDAVATWEQSRLIFPKIRALGLQVALVAQDGINEMAIDYDAFDALFIGGSDQFKLGHEGWVATQRAKRAGKWVHMGRVNSLKRTLYAAKIGCDSVDGTFIGRGPNVNLPKVLSWLEATAPAAVAA